MVDLSKTWEKRFWDIENLEDTLSVASPQYRDPQKYLDNLILGEDNPELAEKRLKLLEDFGAMSKEKTKRLERERAEREYKAKLKELRILRNDFLLKTDWTQSVTDSPLSQEERKNYRLYRKYLRELPKLIENKQVLDFTVLTYHGWFIKKPVFEGSTEI